MLVTSSHRTPHHPCRPHPSPSQIIVLADTTSISLQAHTILLLSLPTKYTTPLRARLLVTLPTVVVLRVCVDDGI